ncbi:S41 family peptidase [Thalassoroseus pseudoceratinae]|uniref:S41 family peptidase n=1 Tax=Thalassoroseus pseudoceratinae TaxID=2713176 RepID=UPI0014249F44|nr:S41 family peptidase [Thalassoroseus pseudoceratinae]
MRPLLAVALLGGLCIVTSNAAIAQENLEAPKFDTPPQDDRTAIQSGAELERSYQWLQAIDHYEKALDKWPNNDYLKYGLRRSKVHFGIERRYADRSFDTQLLTLSSSAALSRFEELLSKVQSGFVDSISVTSFVAHGTESLYLALNNRKFRSHHLQNASAQDIQAMRDILRERYWNKPVADDLAARRTILEVAGLAERTCGLNQTATILEYVFGGCNALDDYSSYLTPDKLNDLYGNIEGEFVGLGIEMKAEGGRGMHLVNVLPDSPALAGGLRPGDYIVAIDGIDCRDMTTDEAAKLLRGQSGSIVRLKYETHLTGQEREGRFTRRAVHVKSIPVVKMLDERAGVGYIRMTGFQKTSAAELDQALAELNRQGMRSLIWDVRGNPGGLLTAAVEVLDRFLDGGVLVSTRGRNRDQNWSYSARPTKTTSIPLVLLVDQDSASASEIVAGALRDHRRGTIIGRQTYGKWSVQSIFPLRGSTGLRLTTAKFYSPNGHTLGKIGVRPDVIVEDVDEHIAAYAYTPDADLLADADVRKGIEVLNRQASR